MIDYQKNKEVYIEKAMKYYKKNRSKCIARMKVYNKKYYRLNKLKKCSVIRDDNKKSIEVNVDKNSIIINFDWE